MSSKAQSRSADRKPVTSLVPVDVGPTVQDPVDEIIDRLGGEALGRSFELASSLSAERIHDLEIFNEHIQLMNKLRNLRPRPQRDGALKRYREKWIPTINGAFRTGLHVCSDCGNLCPQGLEYCPESGCGARSRNRGRGKVGNGKSAAENAVTRAMLRRDRAAATHKKHCKRGLCQRGQWCPVLQEIWDNLLASEDALTKVNPDVTPDDADNICERGGKTPSRSSEPRPVPPRIRRKAGWA
jgi:hypothetical protein